jgi:hypothetical protein
MGFTHLFLAKVLIIKNSSPAKAGVHCAAREFYQVLNRPPAAPEWIPAFAGMAVESEYRDR